MNGTGCRIIFNDLTVTRTTRFLNERCHGSYEQQRFLNMTRIRTAHSIGGN